ncbi:Protein of unknown function [Bacillus mycoides]|uniref:Uncharacterized protein n=1 Tax=Bacillus mycoides TaxID=1405 RepID=A0A1G4EM35_BACMY|nr:Protein of unknown function [Bacillus mycoides]
MKRREASDVFISGGRVLIGADFVGGLVRSW